MQARSKKALLSTTAIIMAGLLISPQVNAQTATPAGGGGSGLSGGLGGGAAGGLGTIVIAAAAIPDNSWNYDTDLSGNVGKDVSTAGITNITVTGGNGFVEGNATIYAGHSVTVTGDSGATFAYRDNRDNIQSTLDGDLTSNMQIVIIDKDGMFFGSDFNADVQGIVATSGDVALGDIMDGGSLTIQNVGDGGKITMNGTITVADAGLAAFVAPFVENNGTINATLGRVQMGAADTVTVDLYGDGLLELAVDGELSDALLENNGDIIAQGGTVQMSALAAKSTVDNIVNNTGIINVASASVVGGKIILSGGNQGTVRNEGIIGGGEVNISGERFVQETALASIETAGGNVDITTSGNVDIAGGYINAGGGDINIDNSGTFSSGSPETLMTEGTGEISVRQNAGGSIQNVIDAIDNTGTGTNTVKVGAGTYNESINADHENLILEGNNAGIAGADTRAAETIIAPNSPGFYVTADNVTIDGFTITGADEGIWVDNADEAILRNNIITNSIYGIFAVNTLNTLIQGNEITNTWGGVYGDNVGNIKVYDNDIIDSLINGIYIKNSNGTNYVDDVDIWKNRISGGAGSTGILVENSDFATVGAYINYQYGEYDSLATGNVIDGVEDGVVIVNSDNTVVRYTTVSDASGTAVTLNNSDDAMVSGNIVNDTQYGIDVIESSNALLNYNNLTDVVEAIHAEFAYGLSVYRNIIAGTLGTGIHVVYSEGVDSDSGVDIWKNNISGGGVSSTGIWVDGSAFAKIGGFNNNRYGEADSLATGNVITGGRYGITVMDSDDSIVTYNTVDGASSAGVSYANSVNSRVWRNVISDSDAGVDIKSSDNLIVDSNEITDTNIGIHAYRADNLWVYDNDIVEAQEVGVYVMESNGTNYVDDVDIWKNRISGGAGSTGILVENSDFATVGAYINYQYGEYDSLATGNVIDGVNDAVVIRDSDNAMAIYSTISDVNGSGIIAENVNNFSVMRNVITNSYENGIYIAGADNGNVILRRNLLTDNGGVSGSANMRFEGGDIDLNIADLDRVNIITNTTGLPAIGLEFDDISGGGLTIEGETLGSTIFEGFAPVGSFYTRFEDGSILDATGSPIVIDGTNASFDGIIPADTGGILSAPDLAFIEERLYDADDAPVNGRGQIFVGAVADDAETIENFEDFFFTPAAFDGAGSGTSITITGMPLVGAIGVGAGAGLNNIEPNAGEEVDPEKLSEIAPAAGGDPAAGDAKNVTCLSDVAGSVNGGSVTYSFGGSFEDSLNGASACSSNDA